MRFMRSRFGIASIAAVVATVAGVGLASANSSDGSARSFTVFAKTVQFAAIDLGDTGTSLGDQAVFSDDLLTAKDGDKVGFDGGVCSLVRRDEASRSDTLQCAFTFSFDGGQIATQALLTLHDGHFSGTEVGPITGGSGKFRGASGEVAVKFFSDDEADITFNLD
jgi:hypothetical protein